MDHVKAMIFQGKSIDQRTRRDLGERCSCAQRK